MEVIYDFIVTNYIWILVAIVLIILAIIGSFIDKSFFGEKGKKDNDDVKNGKTNSDIVPNTTESAPENKLDNVLGNEKKNVVGELPQESDNKQQVVDNIQKEEVANTNTANNNTINTSVVNINNTANTNTANNDNGSVNLMKNIEEKLSSLDNELKSSLPEKNLIDSDILDDIDELNIDETKQSKDNLFEKVKVDDIELPTIKSMKETDKDIWKKRL